MFLQKIYKGTQLTSIVDRWNWIFVRQESPYSPHAGWVMQTKPEMRHQWRTRDEDPTPNQYTPDKSQECTIHGCQVFRPAQLSEKPLDHLASSQPSGWTETGRGPPSDVLVRQAWPCGWQAVAQDNTFARHQRKVPTQAWLSQARLSKPAEAFAGPGNYWGGDNVLMTTSAKSMAIPWVAPSSVFATETRRTRPRLAPLAPTAPNSTKKPKPLEKVWFVSVFSHPVRPPAARTFKPPAILRYWRYHSSLCCYSRMVKKLKDFQNLLDCPIPINNVPTTVQAAKIKK